MSSNPNNPRGFVSAREETVSIPTYPVLEADPNPIFYYGRHYQGARGRIYPYPLLDKLSDNPQPKDYHAVILENSYIELMILPEIGGRLFSAKDKTNGYFFLYRQNVIKPVLIGMVGAWISGGAEWNIPHHHRVSVFMPIDHHIEVNADGSKTLWMTEIEQRHHMKWTLGITLRPDNSYFEVTVKLFNRTPLSQSFLYFTNAAVHANENYQVIFPPQTQWGVQHAKCEFISWPTGHGNYAGIDYTDVDVSWWKNHPNPVSIFAWNDKDNFFGGYDHGKQAGVVRVADRHISPGMKFFEFGNGNIGRMWDTILTDNDGPYVELMSGSYSDNQPDYSWIEPYEVREATECWYPIRDIGGFQHANKDAVVFLNVKDELATFGLHATQPIPGANIRLCSKGTTIYEKQIIIAPDTPYQDSVPYSGAVIDLLLTLENGEGHPIIEYHPETLNSYEMPAPVKSPPSPKDIQSVEELYLTGLRLELFHNPALNAVDYYAEALAKDPNDARTNTRMGILHLKHAEYDKAEDALRKAVNRLTDGYTRPQNGEPLFYLGLTLRTLNRSEEAKELFFRSVSCQAWRAAGYFQLAEMLMEEKDYRQASVILDKSIMMNEYNTEAYCLKSAIQRRLGNTKDALLSIEKAFDLDPLDYRAMYERTLLQRVMQEDNTKLFAELMDLMEDNPNTCMELAFDYGNCGQWSETMDILETLASRTKDRTSPLIWYLMGYAREMTVGVPDKTAVSFYSKGRDASSHLCFPSHLQMIPVLEAAIRSKPDDPRAPYYLGCLLYDHQPVRAMELWERAADLDNKHPQTLRCLAEGYAKQKNNTSQAMQYLMQAMEHDPTDPRFPLELDIIMESVESPADDRLRMLEERRDTILQRDDVTGRMISLYLLAGRYDSAIEILHTRRFHVWEGNEGFVHSLYTDAHLLKGRALMRTGKAREALDEFHLASLHPRNLEMGEPADGGRIAEISYWMGIAYEKMGDAENASKAFQKSTDNERKGSTPAYYQALSWRKLGESQKADAMFEDLIAHATERIKDSDESAFFEKFGQKESDNKRKAQLHYLLGLGLHGRGRIKEAIAEFEIALSLHPNFLAAKSIMEELV